MQYLYLLARKWSLDSALNYSEQITYLEQSEEINKPESNVNIFFNRII